MVIRIVLIAAVCYLLGNANGAIVISRLVARDDVRRHGSGNAGFTNFFRNYGGAVSLLVLLIDGLKAVLACLLGGWLLGKYGYRPEGMMLAAVAVSLGHDFPALLGFRGGKGIMCGFAAAMTIDWRAGLFILAAFAVCYLLTKYVSLSSLMGSVAFAVSFWYLYADRPVMVALSCCVAVLAVFLHRDNIRRLLQGNERKTDFFKKKGTPS